MVAAAPILPYCRFINMFRLGVSPGAMYRISWENTENKPEDVVLEDDGKFYALQSAEYEAKPDYWMMRRLIEQGCRQKLKEANCSFKGPQSYIAYWSKPYPQRFQHTFRVYSGFEFRVAYYASAEDPEATVFYLIVDPHIVLTLVASVADIVRMGIRSANLCGLAARVRERGQGDEFGVDSRILSIIDDPPEPQFKILNFRTTKTKP